MQILKRHRRLTAVLVGCIAVGLGTLAFAQNQRYPASPVGIEITARPIAAFDNRDVSRVRFGALEFRGGLVMTSAAPAFGGISGFHLDADGGRFVAVTDRGAWLRGRIVYRDGAPDAIADAEMAPILGADGKPLAARGWYDVESLTELDGQFYAGIERVHRIVRLDYRKRGLAAQGEPIPVPADFKTLASNKGLECLAGGRKGSALAGTLVAVAEESLDAQGRHRGFLLKGGKTARFAVTQSDAFAITDCAFLPSGDLLLLERHFSAVRGAAMRVRRLPAAAIRPDAVVDGDVLIVADLAYQIDNMEGIAVHRNDRGEIILTIVSDNNFSFIQRNLLLQFALIEDGRGK